MDFNLDTDFHIFDPLFAKRPSIVPALFKQDVKNFYLPFIDKLATLKQTKNSSDGIIVGLSAIQGAGKTTIGEALEILLGHFGHSTVSLSIDDHYITHAQLNELRAIDPRFIRRGVTHDINLATSDLQKLKTMHPNETVSITHYDKSAFNGDGDRGHPRQVTKKTRLHFL